MFYFDDYFFFFETFVHVSLIPFIALWLQEIFFQIWMTNFDIQAPAIQTSNFGDKWC